jgi:hypothetical protein
MDATEDGEVIGISVEE